ncbi:MAG TPA: hypothetical protein VF526_00995 [Solirubrobacteraceae bacterium]|jgi:pyruvate,water dikinase
MIPPTSTTNARPFAFADPADAELLWQHDKTHFPDPLAPMEAATLEQALGHGFTHGVAAYNAPIERVEVRSIDGYHYRSVVMASGSPSELAARAELAEQSVRAAIGQLDELWTERILPEVREHLGFWHSFDLAAATRSALTAHVAETWERLKRVWELHFEIGLPIHLAIREFDELYRDLMPDAGPLDSQRLLEGQPSMTAEVDQELWRLSRRALESNEVCAIIEICDALQIPVMLGTTSAGREFLAELDFYLDRYGRRADKRTLLSPSWTEDATPVIKRLRDFIGRSDGDAPAVVTGTLAARRERAIAAAREELTNYPAEVVRRFETTLAAAQAASVLIEDHDFWIDKMTIHHLRAVLLEAGRRLVDDGAITRASDVFMLEPEELQGALAQPGIDLRFATAVRAHAMKVQALMSAPPVLGTVPARPQQSADPFARFIATFNKAPSMEQAPER